MRSMSYSRPISLRFKGFLKKIVKPSAISRRLQYTARIWSGHGFTNDFGQRLVIALVLVVDKDITRQLLLLIDCLRAVHGHVRGELAHWIQNVESRHVH